MRKRSKIGILIPRLGVEDRGAEVFVYDISRYLTKYYDIVIWTRGAIVNSELLKLLSENGITIKTVRSLGEESFPAQVFYKGKKMRRMFDVLHLNPREMEMLFFSLACFRQLIVSNCDLFFPNNGLWGALVCRLVRLIKGKPFIYTSHGGIEPLIARQRPDAYVALNEGIQSWLKEHFPNLRVELIRNGVDLERFSPEGKRLVLGIEAPVFISVGELIPVKRMDKAIRAVARLKRGSLLILGSGPLEDKIRGLGIRLLGKKRFLLLRSEHRAIAEYYRSADVFTLAAKGEPGSLVYLEAIACGLPVVGHKESHLEEVVGSAGILVDTDDIVKYSEALEQAGQRKFKQNSRQQAKKFSLSKVGGKYNELCAELLGG